MKTLAILAGTLAFTITLATPRTAHGQHRTAAALDAVTIVKNTLRHNVSINRSVAWRWQDKAGLERSQTRYLERHGSVPYLRTLVHLWHDRAYEAMKAARRRVTAPAVDGCLSELIQRESGWDAHASNPSGAYGLPQALPGSKMASAGADWRDNPATQIRWMIGYVARYGGSCAALAFQKANGYY